MDNRTIIKSIRIENFGCFRDRKINFSSGVNQVIGENESGKSTLLRALYTVVFEDSTTRKKAVASQANWKNRKAFRIILDFSVGDKNFNLVRDYGAGREIMTDSDGLTYEGKNIPEKLEKYFGTADRNLFESIFSFSSDNPAAPESSKGKLQAAIETPVFSGFNRSRADQFLEAEIKKLENPRAHGPRELDLISDRITQRLQEKTEIEEKLDRLEKDRKELDEVRLTLREHEERVEKLEKDIEGTAAYLEVNNRMIGLEERLQGHLGNYSRASQVAEDLVRIETEMNRFDAPDLDEIEEAEDRQQELTEAVDSAKLAMDNQIVRRKKANRGFAAASLGLLLLCLVYIAIQNGYIRPGTMSDIVPYTIPVMAIVWISRMIVYLTQFYKKKKMTTRFRENVSGLDEFYAALNEKYNLQAADPVKAMKELAQKYRTLEMSAGNLRETIAALSEGKGLEYLTSIRQQLEGEVAQLNQALSPLTSFAALADKLPDLKEELISRRVRANAMRERAALLTERCSVIDTWKENLSRIEDEVEILKQKHRNITEHLEVLKITRMALNRAADQLIEDTFGAFGEAASTYLESLTGGVYDHLRFHRDNGCFEVKIGETDRWIEISDNLSSSTRDCIYLALRLAGVKKLSQDFAPPILLDQVETRMDNRRRQCLYNLLTEIASERQVFYIGLREVEAWPANNIIGFSAEKTAAVETGRA